MLNKVLLKRIVALALAMGAIQWLLDVSPLGRLPWALLGESFLIGLLVLHKRSVSIAWLNNERDSWSKGFLKSIIVYFIPASLLWILFGRGFLLTYLPASGLLPAPPLAALFGTVGVLALGRALLSRELSKLRGLPP
jgi:hypothetical protein